MYQGMLPKTGTGITVMGVTATTMNLIWFGVALGVLGGTMITLSKFGPRIAVEPMPVGLRGTKWRITKNGKPLFRRRK